LKENNKRAVKRVGIKKMNSNMNSQKPKRPKENSFATQRELKTKEAPNKENTD
jgi:hypothetical protein